MDDLTRRALATAVGTLAAVFAAFHAGLEQPYWAAIGVLIVSNADPSALLTKGLLRVLGTAGGVVLGYMVALRVEGLPVIQAVLLILSAALGTYARQRATYAYAWFYGSLTFMLMILCSMTTPGQLYAFAWNRCYEIMFGVVAATLAHWAICPPTEHVHILAGKPAQEPGPAFKQAVAAGLGVITIVLTWSIFDLPEIIQVVISSLVVIDSTADATRHKSWQRILGCFIGGVAGIIAVVTIGPNLIMWSAALFGGVLLSARVHLGTSPSAYIGTQSAVALIVTMVDVGPPDSISPPLNRLLGIMVGVTIISLIVWLVNAKVPARAGAPEPSS